MPHAFNKVFGIGLSRTGTLSLAAALTELGLRAAHFPSDETTFTELSSGAYELTVLRELDAIVDTPASAFFAQLDHHYPESRFVLTIRERDGWLRSCEKLWRFTGEVQRRPFHRFINGAMYGTWEFSAERFAYVYDRHLREVRDHFRDRPERLLELDIVTGEGWDRLCPFLELPLPACEFPHRDLLSPGRPG